MQIPFTAQQFFEVIARYNQAVWPAPLLLHALALLAVVFVPVFFVLVRSFFKGSERQRKIYAAHAQAAGIEESKHE